jgi:hypothetical protein
MTQPGTRPTDARRTALSLAALTFGAASSFAYAAQRVFERLRGGAGDPLLVVFDLHTAFYWRAATAAWWGGVAAILVFAVASRPRGVAVHDRAARALAVLVVPLALAIAVTMWRLP